MSSTKQVVVDLKILSSDAAKNISDLNVKIGNLQKTMEGMRLAGLANSDQYHKLEAVMKDLKQTVKANEKALVEGIKQQKSSGDSINAMRAQLKLLRREYEDLSRVQREGVQGNKLLTDIDTLTTEIKKLEFAQQDFSRQVGEYDVITQPARTALREMKMECQNLAVALDVTSGKIQAQETVVANLAATVGTSNQEYADAVAELDRLNKAYDDTKAKLSEMEQKTGELADTIADSNKRVSAFANDEQRFAAMQEGVQALGAAFTAVQGSMALLGVESKSLLEVYAKIQIVQQTLNSLMTIYKALNKDSNFMIALRVKLEKARLTWTKAYNAALARQNGEVAANTAAEAANATATTAVTAAQTAATTATFSFRAALEALKVTLMSNPFTAIAVAVTVAVTAIVVALKKLRGEEKKQQEAEEQAAKAEKERLDTFRDRVREQASSMSQVAARYDEEIAKIQSLVRVSQSETASYRDKKLAIDELNRVIPAFNGSIDETGRLIRGNIDAIDEYIGKLRQKAMSEAYYQLLVDEYKKQAELEREWYIAKEALGEKQEKLFRNEINGYRDLTSEELGLLTQQVAEETKVVNEMYGNIARQNEVVQQMEELAARNVDVSTITGGTPAAPKAAAPQKAESGEDDAVKEAKKMYDRLVEVAKDYQYELEKLGDNALDAVVRRENERYLKELDGLVEAYNHSLDLLNKGDDFLVSIGLDPEAVRRYRDTLSDAMDEAAARNKANVQKIRDDWQKALDEVAGKTDAAYKELTRKLRDELARDGKTGIERLRTELGQQLAALQREEEAELSAHEYTEEQKTEISRLYAEKRQNLIKSESDAEKQVWMQTTVSVMDAMASVTSSISNLFNTLAEDNSKYSDFATGIAMAQILISSAVSIAQAIQAAVQAGGFTGPAAPITIPVFIAEMVGIVASGIASAVSTLKQAQQAKGSAPRFATGGEIRHGQSGVDKVPIMATRGEYVIKKEKVDEYGVDFFDALNFGGHSVKHLSVGDGSVQRFAGGGVVASLPAVLPAVSAGDGFDYDTLKDAMRESVSDALTDMPSPVVSVREVTNAQKRVRVKENISRNI